MFTKDVFHDWNKVLFKVDYQSFRVSRRTRYAVSPCGCSGTIYNILLSIINIYFLFKKKTIAKYTQMCVFRDICIQFFLNIFNSTKKNKVKINK